MRTRTQRWTAIVCALVLCLGLAACDRAAEEDDGPTWREQYNLGLRYLEDGNYEEAILAFEAAIDINPRRADAYIGLADAYMGLGDEDAAREAIENGRAACDEGEAFDQWLEKLESSGASDADRLQRELAPAVAGLDLPLTVDGITWEVSNIEEAKAAYRDLPYASSNLMDDGAEDTVYRMFGADGEPIPEGHHEREFMFLFAGAPGGVVDNIYIAEPGFLCLGSLQVGGEESEALAFFHFPDTPPEVELSFDLDNGGRLVYTPQGTRSFYFFDYYIDGAHVTVKVTEGVIQLISIAPEEREETPEEPEIPEEPEEPEEPEMPDNGVVDVVLERQYDGNYVNEFAVITGLDAQGSAVWTYTTQMVPSTQLESIVPIGVNGGRYYYVEYPALVAMDLQTGEVLWRNEEVYAGSAHGAFSPEGNILICGYFGPDFMAISPKGETLVLIDTFDQDYNWAYDIQVQGDRAVVTLEMGPDETEGRFWVDLNTWEYGQLS